MTISAPSPRTRYARAPVALALAAVLAGACAGRGPTAEIRFGGAKSTQIAGLVACADEGPDVLDIDPDRPLVLFVHGCNGSAGRFRALAEVFEAHGQQTICFSYDDRESLADSSGRLAAAIEELRGHLRHRDLTILGHSQGGLVARRALIAERPDRVAAGDDHEFRLVTVSSPFNGIAASSDCASVVLHVLTLGVSVGLCAAIAGAKWNEIHDEAAFVREPGTLVDVVSGYVKVVTDERGTCRRYDADGECVEGDFVFSVPEQYNTAIDTDRRVTNLEVKAGHVEIVGDEGTPPVKLIGILQSEGVLAETPPERRAEIAALLRRLF